jgi:cellulose synthase/poly-beta-1,6-N-acetylglucosamine synthase-like glycosyltransferase
MVASVKGRGIPDFTPRTSMRDADGVLHRPAEYNPRPTTLPRPADKQPLLLAARAGRRAGLVKRVVRKKKMALLLPGHNEELIIATTIASAIKAGQPREDIYVVDDGSEDKTRREALKMLPRQNVLSKPKGGKAMAVLSGIERFQIEERYTWLHVADADSVFCPDYFRMYKRKLDPKKYAVAVGFVQSLRGNWISRYRAFTYTYSQQVLRRVQSWFGMISVFPGPITCFRTDIIKSLDFTANSMTEDFDLTLQVHRKKLGKIKYIPEAINYTQDPQTLRDFIKQNMRWQRGFFQGVMKYKIGLRPQRVDIGLGYQMLELLFYLIQMFVLLPYIVYMTGRWEIIPIALGADFLVTCALAVFSAVAAKRLAILGSLPYFYFLRWIEIGIVVIAYFEVIAMRKFRAEKFAGWTTKGRRYALDANALKDTA